MNRLFPLLLLLISASTFAESGAYRVEIIVFRNLHVEAEATEIEELRSFSQFPDAMEIASGSETTEPSTGTTTESALIDPAGLPVPDSGTDLPDELQLLPERTEYMDDFWRRLRGSANYRPLVYAAWEQNRTDYYPPMRIHDENIIDSQLRPPTHVMVADLTAEDPLAKYRSTFYQLDGSVQLRRSRFLHVFLDLEYRETSSPVNPESATEIVNFPIIGTNLEQEADHRVFTLKQNRQVRTGAVQYFDTPQFGALVFVSAISAN